MGYTGGMEPSIEFNPAAFKHGASEADIRHAITTARYDGPIEDGNNKYLLVGFDTRANPLEVLYNEMGDNGMYVFHAMTCRNAYLHFLNY
jgi:hypothetical protein